MMMMMMKNYFCVVVVVVVVVVDGLWLSSALCSVGRTLGRDLIGAVIGTLSVFLKKPLIPRLSQRGKKMEASDT